MLTFQHNFVSELNGFSATESRELSLNENVYNSSGDQNFIDKSDIFKYS